MQKQEMKSVRNIANKKIYRLFLIHPNDVLKADKTPYKVFTAFYNSLEFLHSSNNIKEFETPKNLKKADFDYSFIPTLNDLGLKKQDLPDFFI